jgi:hypothetical protein
MTSTSCTSSIIGSNCIRFQGSEIGVNTTKSIVLNGGTIQVTLSNWVLHQNNTFKCFNYFISGNSSLFCANVNTTNGNQSITGTSGSYCAPVTTTGNGKNRVTTQHTINSVTFCFGACQQIFGGLDASATEVCSQNTTVHYSIPFFANQNYVWYLNNQVVNGTFTGYQMEYVTPADLPVGQHIIKLVVSNICESVEFISNLTVKQSPVATITNNLNIESGVVASGSQLNLSWSIAFAPSATFEHFVNGVVVASQTNVTSGSYSVALIDASHKVVITATNPASGCVLVREIPFNVFGPQAVPVITLNFFPELIDGNKMNAYNDYVMTWSATNVSPNDKLIVDPNGQPIELFPGQPLIFNLFPGTKQFDFSITNPYNVTGTKSITIVVV